jgi:ParB-like chromosome segregation protein Spo0J
MERTVVFASGIAVHCAHDALLSLADLLPKLHPKNANEHPDSQLILYAAAIKARGWRESVTVSLRSGFVVKGNGGVLAAQKLGVDQVPVEFQNYASDEEELADMLAHNRLPELSRTSRQTN